MYGPYLTEGVMSGMEYIFLDGSTINWAFGRN
jgi:hypothetical protein